MADFDKQAADAEKQMPQFRQNKYAVNPEMNRL